MKLGLFLFLFILMFTTVAQARIEVAFLEAWTPTGKKVELEKGGRFAHVAIRYQQQWLHAYPTNGVELVYTFHVFGDSAKVTEILIDERLPDLTAVEIARFIGLPYDFKFRWEDTYGSYCSKLIAKLLGVLPEPMKFDGSYWNGIKDLPRGEPGISPDGLYRQLKLRGFISVKSESFPRKKAASY